MYRTFPITAGKLKYSRLPEKYWTIIPKWNNKNDDLLAKAIEDLPAKLARGDNTFVLGSRGSGKTIISSAIIRKAIKYGFKPLYINLNDLWQIAAFSKHRNQFVEGLDERLESTDLLVIDRFNPSLVSKPEHLVKLVEFIEARIGAVKSTILVSSCTAEQLKLGFDDFLLESIGLAYDVIELETPDYSKLMKSNVMLQVTHPEIKIEKRSH